MRKFLKGILKQYKRTALCFPGNIRLSFYMSTLGEAEVLTNGFKDVSFMEKFDVNPDLFDQVDYEVEGNILALLDEGVLKGIKTGADLGLFNYADNEICDVDYSKYINNKFVRRIDDEPANNKSFFDSDKDYVFTHCILADNDPLSSQNTQVITTFKGYLEVTSNDFSIIRKCTCDNNEISTIYIHKDDVNKYRLRHGDEIVCTCQQNDGKMVLNTLFSINQQSRYMWNINRPWFKNLNTCKTLKELKAVGEYSKAIVNKFGLFEGDNVFIYLNKSTQKSQVLSKLIQELSAMFDKVIYINPQYQSSIILENGNNVVKFCAPVNATNNYQTTVVLLGVQHARRLIEMGKRVVLLIDNLEVITSLDKIYAPEMPISKTILATIKPCENCSCTSFGLISLRTNDINSYKIPNGLKNYETLGLVVDCNEIDIFNSYRI